MCVIDIKIGDWFTIVYDYFTKGKGIYYCASSLGKREFICFEFSNLHPKIIDGINLRFDLGVQKVNVVSLVITAEEN